MAAFRKPIAGRRMLKAQRNFYDGKNIFRLDRPRSQLLSLAPKVTAGHIGLISANA